jgi:hypothetical protein
MLAPQSIKCLLGNKITILPQTKRAVLVEGLADFDVQRSKRFTNF